MAVVKITLEFEIDDMGDSIDYLKRDFLNELSCCCNLPYEESFKIKAEYANGEIKER